MSKTTPVIFRRWSEREGGDIIALFPKQPCQAPYTLSYQHIGQHAAADYRFVWQHSSPVKATEPGAKELLNELRQVGYTNLKVYQRGPR